MSWCTKIGSIRQHVFALFEWSSPPSRLLSYVMLLTNNLKISVAYHHESLFLLHLKNNTVLLAGSEVSHSSWVALPSRSPSFVSRCTGEWERMEDLTNLQLVHILSPRSHPDTKGPEKCSLPAFLRKGSRTGGHLASLHPTPWHKIYMYIYFTFLLFVL